uniref:Uncharacterized protein n=1 Tax=Anguilla anguilla TaxID=7936 RepID=A0A0E9W8Y1_ANGAN
MYFPCFAAKNIFLPRNKMHNYILLRNCNPEKNNGRKT